MKFTILSAAITFSLSLSAWALPTYRYHCQSKVLDVQIQAVDKGRTYPDNPRMWQRTYAMTYSVHTKADGKVLIEGNEDTQAYAKAIDGDVITWDFSFAYNPEGGGFDQPLESIWIKSNHRDYVEARYYRKPYLNHPLSCKKQ